MNGSAASTPPTRLSNSTWPRAPARSGRTASCWRSNRDSTESLLDTPLFYTSPRGAPELREAIAEMQGVDPEHVQIVTGSSEALLALFYFAAEPGANVVLPYPEFPAVHGRRRVARDRDPALPPARRKRLPHRPRRGPPRGRPQHPYPARQLAAQSERRGARPGRDGSAARFLRRARRTFVSDEVYHPIYHGARPSSAARLPHATVLGDFSKALCLSGLRIGWVVERDRRAPQSNLARAQLL